MKKRVLPVIIMPLAMIFAAHAAAQNEGKQNKSSGPQGRYASEISGVGNTSEISGAGYASELPVKEKAADIKVPPGMELKKIGALNLLVPEGARVYKDRSQWIMEGPEDYSARNISEIKARLDGIEKEQKGLKISIEELKESLKKPQEKQAPAGSTPS